MATKEHPKLIKASQTRKGDDLFPKTSMTLYRRVTNGDRDVALEEFFKQYWYPMYVFMRGQGETHEDACDLVQGFIVDELLGRDQIGAWEKDAGRLRTFLKVALDRYRRKQHRNESTIRRGGVKSKTHDSLDFEWARGRYRYSAIDNESPDKIYEKEWAESVIQQTLAVLAKMYSSKNRIEEFQLLCRNLSARSGDGEQCRYLEIAGKLGIKENNVKQRMKDFRELFKQILVNVISKTTAREELQAEVDYIYKIMTGRDSD